MLGGVRGHLRRQARVPGHLVEALRVAAGLAGGLLNEGRRQPEEDGRLAHQPLGPVAALARADEALAAATPDERASGRDLDRVELRHGAELGRREGHLAIDLLRRAERAQQRRDGRAGVLGHALLADPARDLGVARDLRGGAEQRGGLVHRDPIGHVVEIVDGPLGARSREQFLQALVTLDPANPPQQDARLGACEMPALASGPRLIPFCGPFSPGYRQSGRFPQARGKRPDWVWLSPC